MDPVIPASRLALGRTVLAAPVVAPVPARPVAAVGVGDTADAGRPSAVDADEAREALERRIRKAYDVEMAAEVESVRAAARREGFERGVAEGREAAQAKADAAIASHRSNVDGALKAIAEAHAAAVASWQNDIGMVAFEALGRVVAKRAGDRDFLMSLVATVCRGAGTEGQITARLHPRDVALLAPSGEMLALPSGVRLVLVADEALAAGGCVVDAPNGRFDGSLPTQLARLRSAMCGDVDGSDKP